MAQSFDVSQQLRGFSGFAPLFPLPDVACFPHVLLPLHVFEPRYRRMTADVLNGERYIAIAQLKPGFGGLKSPPIYEHVCLGQIAAEEQLPDGRYYLVVEGLVRARVVSEESNDLPYRVARLELRPDVSPSAATIDRENRRRELFEALRDVHPRLDLDRLLHEGADLTLCLGLVCDVIASAVPLSPECVQQLLAEENVDLRSDLLLARLRELRQSAQSSRVPKTFPPMFSPN